MILGWDDPRQYCANAEHTYFGATIGRVANRIRNCEFELGGRTHKVSCNEKGDARGLCSWASEVLGGGR